jgi:hypothetical protein
MTKPKAKRKRKMPNNRPKPPPGKKLRRRRFWNGYDPYIGVLFVRNLPKDLKDYFKAVCARRGDTMGDVITALMRLYAERPGLVNVKKNAWRFRYVPPKGGGAGYWVRPEDIPEDPITGEAVTGEDDR